MSDEDTSSPPPKPAQVYQIKGFLKGISPMIWRRFLLTDETTLGQLHTILQIAMGWSNECLHQFRVHGKDYCVPRLYGLEYHRDARQMHLRDFRLRPGEHFAYTYNMMAPWEMDLRVEQILALEPTKRYPRCIGGARAGPDEFLAGPEDYRQWCQARNSYEALCPFREDMALLGKRVMTFLNGGKRPSRNDKAFMQAYERIQERIDTDPERFDRRRLNAALQEGKEPSCTFEFS